MNMQLGFRSIAIKSFLIGLFVTGLLADVFVFQSTSDLRVLTLLGLWFVVKKTSLFDRRVEYIGLTVLWTIQVGMYVFSQSFFAVERISLWIYIFFVIIVFGELRALARRSKK